MFLGFVPLVLSSVMWYISPGHCLELTFWLTGFSAVRKHCPLNSFSSTQLPNLFVIMQPALPGRGLVSGVYRTDMPGNRCLLSCCDECPLTLYIGPIQANFPGHTPTRVVLFSYIFNYLWYFTARLSEEVTNLDHWSLILGVNISQFGLDLQKSKAFVSSLLWQKQWVLGKAPIDLNGNRIWPTEFSESPICCSWFIAVAVQCKKTTHLFSPTPMPPPNGTHYPRERELSMFILLYISLFCSFGNDLNVSWQFKFRNSSPETKQQH